jgi:hypothetical protein
MSIAEKLLDTPSPHISWIKNQRSWFVRAPARLGFRQGQVVRRKVPVLFLLRVRLERYETWLKTLSHRKVRCPTQHAGAASRRHPGRYDLFDGA